MNSVKKNVKVVVLGDIGRSPRMQYHSLSLAKMGHQVDLIGYGDTEPMEAVKLEPMIFYHYLLPLPVIKLRFLNYIFKTIMQALNLLFLMFVTTRSDIVLVQNPPAIPSLIVCWIYSRIIGAKLVIDWHNYAHTIMALSVGSDSALVRITKKFEKFVGQRADHNFCVTSAMKDDLSLNWNIKAVTLYDRALEMFKPISPEEKRTFSHDFGDKYNKVLTGTNRPGLLVSSTSWTEDEDFSVLFSALQDYETHIIDGNCRHLPQLLCVITGKGPLKDYYIGKINGFKWKHVSVILPWLKTADYPLLLASADLGVSLHTSSSGLDLPMKVVDMFGCGLPVCAYDFKCLGELVKHGENSFTFKSPQQLSEIILNWFEDFPNNTKQQVLEQQFKNELKTFQNVRWQDNWTKIASPIFK